MTLLQGVAQLTLKMKTSLSKATDKQLITITNYDRECPKELMEPVVMEMLNRRLFKNFIFNTLRGLKFHDMDDNDVEQIGNIAIWEAVNTYKPGKAAFASFAKVVLLHKVNDLFQKRKAVKRHITHFAFYLEDQEGIENIIPNETNVEKYVLHRIYFEQQIGKLTKLQKAAVLGYMKGYRLREIAKTLEVPRQSIERAFHRGVEKMGGEPFSIKDNSGMKGA
jgi:RNA polymerase sigma factor (sigma-70 family)